MSGSGHTINEITINSFPSTLLLTHWKQDGRYAGAEAIRRMLSCFPADRIRWASLRRMDDERSLCPLVCKSFEPRRVHWRLTDTLWDSLCVNEFQAARLARQIANWVQDFQPELIWTLPELGAVNVVNRLRRLLDVPVHATVFDAPETAAHVCLSKSYVPLYMRHIRKLYGSLDSLDAVSRPLVEHLRSTGLIYDQCATMVCPASVSAAWAIRPDKCPFHARKEPVRRLGICGAFRVSTDQWRQFTDLLEALPYEFEIIAFTAPETLPEMPGTSRVSFKQQPYVENEREIVERFSEEKVDACYLGLWNEPEKHLFVRTSLSSKLTTYAAAGLPVILDGPTSSAAGELIVKHGAGVICETSAEADREHSLEMLQVLLADEETWLAYSKGAQELFGEVFEVETNSRLLAEQLRSIARGTKHCSEKETP